MPILDDAPDNHTIGLLIVAGAVAVIMWNYHRRTCPYKDPYAGVIHTAGLLVDEF